VLTEISAAAPETPAAETTAAAGGGS
jgi:hypothetical protein